MLCVLFVTGCTYMDISGDDNKINVDKVGTEIDTEVDTEDEDE